MQDMERKTFKFEVKEVDVEQGIIEGYGSTFSKVPDSYGDIVDEGAFTKTIKENMGTIVSLFNHSIQYPIGKPELSTDKKGLWTRIKIVRGVQKAEETLLLAKAGVITQMSIGYNTIKESWEKGIRHLQEVKLYDVSPVVFAANTEAVITGVKRDNNDIKAGRVLSATNLAKVKKAFDALQALLASLAEEEEPAKATQLSEEATEEAVKVEAIISTLKAENDGIETKEAEKRIEAILEKLTKKTGR